MQYDKINTKNANESKHSEMGPVRQNPIQRTIRTAHLSVVMTVHNFSTQYTTEQCQEMENIIRVSLWFGMLRQPSRDSIGGARAPELCGRRARCRMVGRSHMVYL